MLKNTDFPVQHLTDVFIDNSSSEVWKTLCDVQNWKTWQSNISRSSAVGSIIPGAVFTFKHRGEKITAKITESNENTVFEWFGSSFFNTYLFRWELKQTRNGTHVIVRAGFNGTFAGFFADARKKLLKKDLITWTITLKSECEGE